MNDRESGGAIRVRTLKTIEKIIGERNKTVEGALTTVEKARTKKIDLETKIIEQELRERNIRLDIMHKLADVPKGRYLNYIRCYLLLTVIIILLSGFQFGKGQGYTSTYSLSPYVVGVFIVTSFTALGTFLAIFLKWVYRTDRKEKDK